MTGCHKRYPQWGNGHQRSYIWAYFARKRHQIPFCRRNLHFCHGSRMGSLCLDQYRSFEGCRLHILNLLTELTQLISWRLQNGSPHERILQNSTSCANPFEGHNWRTRLRVKIRNMNGREWMKKINASHYQIWMIPSL